MSDAAVDTSSEITTKDLKEKKEVVEEAENGRDAPANGNAVRKRMEMKMRRLRQLRANGQ
uniref:Prothymosin alpha n=2 Tax=Marmotini TaxID=337730 RepID=A0A287DF04_ICTTR